MFMKKLLSLALALLLVLTCLPMKARAAEVASGTSNHRPAKLLDTITIYNEKGELADEAVFQYDEYDRLISISWDTGIKGTSVSFKYDSAGRLLSKKYADSGSGNEEYTYNDDGQLIRYEGMVGHLYEYNSVGQLVKMTSSYHIGSTVTTYNYDEHGQLIQTTAVETYNEFADDTLEVPPPAYSTYSYDNRDRISQIRTTCGSDIDTQTFEYDDQDRVIHHSFTWSSDLHPSNSRYSDEYRNYDDYKPFIVSKCTASGTLPNVVLRLESENGDNLETLYTTSLADLYSDDDGYLIKLVDDTYYDGKETWHFTYRDANVTQNSNNTHTEETGYISAVQKAIEDSQAYSWGTGHGILHDIDGNGIEELILVYTAKTKSKEGHDAPTKVCAVYTLSQGKAITLIDSEVLYIEAGGAGGYAAVVKKEDNTYFAVTSSNGDGTYSSGSWKLYAIDGTSIELNTHVEYDRSSAVINGTACSYREYEEWANGLSEMLCVDPYRNENLLSLEELLEHLKNNPIEDKDTSTPIDDPSFEDIQESENRNGLVVYSDYTNLSIRKGSVITLSAGIFADGELIGDVSGITFQIEDISILSVSTTDIKDNRIYVKLKGLVEGTTNVVFCDSATGNTVVVPITVYENRKHSYTLSNVPTQQIEKYTTNFYNVNGLYIDNYKYTVHDDQSATVSFDVYNTNYSYGAVEIFDENGKLKDAVLISKMTSSNTSFKEAVLDNLAYLVRDLCQGDMFSYRQESGFSKMTPVSVKVPQNGYIKICTDPENSSIVGLVNYADLLLSMLDLTGEITGFSAKSDDFAGKLTAKVLNEKIFAELVSDSNKMTQTLWKNASKEALITPEAMGNFVDTAIKNLSDFGLLDVVLSTASDCGWNIGEKVFTDLAGPFGVALKVMFTIGKAENIIIQYHDVTHSAGIGSIVIQNQGGGIRSCQQIKVESEDGFADDTALNVFSVTLESDVLDLIEKYNPDIHEQIVNGVTYTYNISLMKDGSETQPNGEVTVYIPIPDELKALAYAGDWIDGVPIKAKIYRIEKDGTLTEMNTRIEDGCFVFTTNHFSLYTIVGYDSGDDATPNQDDHNLVTIVIVGIAAVVIVGMGSIVMTKQKKK